MIFSSRNFVQVPPKRVLFFGGETIEKEEGVYCGMCSLISTICWFILKSEVGGRTDRSGFEARDSNNKVITAAPLDGQVT